MKPRVTGIDRLLSALNADNCKKNILTLRMIKIDKLKKEKESNHIKIDSFENASKSLDKLIRSQITDNSKTWLWFTSYNVVAPPPTGLFAPPSIVLSDSGLEELKQPVFEGYGPKDSKSVSVDTSNEIKKAHDAPIIEDWVSDSDEDESEEMVLKSENVQHKTEQVNQPRNVSQNPKNIRPNWNKIKTQKLEVEFQFTKKACFVCGSFSHLIKDCDFRDKRMVQKPVLKNVEKGTVQRKVRSVWNNAIRTNHQNFSNSRKNFAPTAVLTKSGIVPISTARQSSSRAATPETFHQQTTLKNGNLNNNVNAAKANSVNTAKENKVTSDVGNHGINIVKSSTCLGAPRDALKDQGYFNCGCSRHITGNISYLTNFQSMMEGMLPLGEELKVIRLLAKAPSELMCDKKNSVLFTDTEYFVLSPNFKFADESQVLLKVSRKNNMYSFDMKNIVPQKDLTCLLAKAANDESMLWHKRLGHINFKNINKLVKDNLVRRLPSKRFKNDQTYVACLKGKQHKVSFKSKLQNSISQPLFMLHMDLFGPTSMSSIMHKKYCLVVIDDFSRFTWVFFLATKNDTSRIIKILLTEIENLVEKKVKIIRYDNVTKFKNTIMNEFCEEKGIKREYSVARTPQQNRVAERRNRKLIEATRTMLTDSKSPVLSFMRSFGCHVSILNTLDQLGKFDGKSDEGIFVGYSTTSKAFRVYNIRTRKVEENLHITFLENKPMIVAGGPEWLFDIDALLKSINYAPVSTGTNSNDFAGKGASFDVGQLSMETESSQDYILMPLWKDNFLFDSSSQYSDDHNKDKHGPSQASESDNQEGPNAESSTKSVNTARPVNTATPTYADYPNDPLMPDLEDAEIFDDAYDDRDEGAEADYNNLETVISVSPIPSTRIHKDHPKEHIIKEVNSAVQTRKMAKQNEAGLISFINKQRTNHKYFQNCLFACFISQMEPKKITQALDDESWVEAMQEELLQFKLLNVWTLVDLPPRKRAIGTKWVYRNKRDQREIVVRNKARLVAQGHRQEKGIDYDNFFASVARIEAIRRGTIDKTLFIKKIKDDILLVQVYVDDIIFSSTKRYLSTEFEQLMHKRFQMSSMGELTFFLGLQVEKKKDGIFLSQDKYVSDILKKFGFSSVKSASTPMETHKPLSKDANGIDVDVHLYRSMIGSLMYLTSSRPDIMFVVCASLRVQVQPKVSHSPLELIAYSDSDYAGASLDRKSTTGGCQFLGSRLISWPCKKQTIVANSTTEAKYIAASNYCG
uniref:Integrase catalytic domain-containing protein n=1 Tax=Tanacetum cinerariifolium TaxID=118510 RepID=A0A699GZN4_TANCI|nr:hypothetical protein [Tanacetum cinerariifolium]